jgi:hypothetical protein
MCELSEGQGRTVGQVRDGAVGREGKFLFFEPGVGVDVGEEGKVLVRPCSPPLVEPIEGLLERRKAILCLEI